MTRKLTEIDFAMPGVVSIWLGNFTQDCQLDCYFFEGETFEHHYEFSLSATPQDPVFTESLDLPYQEDGDEYDVRSIFELFSWSQQWIEAAVAAATKKGWSKASFTMLMFNLKYDPARYGLTLPKIEVTPRLDFIGSFAYDPQQDQTSIYTDRRKRAAKPLSVYIDDELKTLCQKIAMQQEVSNQWGEQTFINLFKRNPWTGAYIVPERAMFHPYGYDGPRHRNLY